jgi:histidinol-phosphatase (PHP family)
MKNLADFHVHPGYSIDAEGDITEYCERALKLGLRAICFTTHYDSNPKRAEIDGFWKYNGSRVRLSDSIVEKYVEDIQRAREIYDRLNLDLFCGLEIDYYPGVEKEVERLRARFPFDFMIGSVHCLDDVAISDKSQAPAYFAARSVDQMADDYFGLLLMAARCRSFDCLGHLDYYVRFGWKYYGDLMDKIEIERFDNVFSTLKKSGVGIEINTSPFKTGGNTFHPSSDVIDRAINCGVSITSVGSDCHRPADLGKGVAEAYDFLSRRDMEPVFPNML